MSRLFGTDGVRGIANKELTPEAAFKLAYAAVSVLDEYKFKDSDLRESGKVLIGKDTRISSSMLEDAMAAGFCAAGCDVVSAGVIPTPAVAYITDKYNLAAGVMISASHNSYEYNGIKIFADNGMKLPDEIEDKIEAAMSEFPGGIYADRPAYEQTGRHSFNEDIIREYEEHLLAEADFDLKGMKIAIDCANGAAYQTAPYVFSTLGAEILTMACEPDGININDNCGSTHLEALKRFVLENNCDLGVAFDGDADRLMLVDANGEEVDGDAVMAIIAEDFKKENKLQNNTLVATVMSNMGLEKAMNENSIEMLKTKVGDRYVLETMLAKNCSLGGEQSGHIIMLDHSTTGDGQLSAIKLLHALAKSGKSLAEAKKIMKKYPQVLENVVVSDEVKHGLADNAELAAMIARIEKDLADRGRILVRASGTEPKIRVMAEGEDIDEIRVYVQEICEIFR